MKKNIEKKPGQRTKGLTDDQRLDLLWSKEILGREQIAEALGKGLSTIDLYISKGFIPSAIFEGRRVFSGPRIFDWMTGDSKLKPEELKAKIEGECFARRLREVEVEELRVKLEELLAAQGRLLKRSLSGDEADFARDAFNDRMCSIWKLEDELEKVEREMFKDAGVEWLLPKPRPKYEDAWAVAQKKKKELEARRDSKWLVQYPNQGKKK